MKKINMIDLSITFIALILPFFIFILITPGFMKFRCKAIEGVAKITLKDIFTSQLKFYSKNDIFAKNLKELKEESDIEIESKYYDFDMYTFDQGQSFEAFAYGKEDKRCIFGSKIVQLKNGSQVNGRVLTIHEMRDKKDCYGSGLQILDSLLRWIRPCEQDVRDHSKT